MPKPKPTTNPALLTPAEVMARLRVSRTTLWRMIGAGRLHRINLTTRVMRFRLDEVEAIERGDPTP